MTSSKISIIVPVYNVEQYLNFCIDSILAQVYTDFEVLLIDDGSTDNSGKICDEYSEKDSRISVFHKENGGVSSARNVGLDNASGKYICFVDADDWIENTYVQYIIENIGNADIMFFDECWHYFDGCSQIYSSGYFKSDDRTEIEAKILQMTSNSLRHNFFGYTWNKVFLNSIIKKNYIRFVNGLSASEDEVFTLEYCQYVRRFKVTSLSYIYNYRSNDCGLTHTHRDRKMWMMLASSLEERILYLKNASLITLYHHRIVSIYVNAAISDLCVKSVIDVFNYAKKTGLLHFTLTESLRLLAKKILKK